MQLRFPAGHGFREPQTEKLRIMPADLSVETLMNRDIDNTMVRFFGSGLLKSLQTEATENRDA